jgi:hypothetical protein
MNRYFSAIVKSAIIACLFLFILHSCKKRDPFALSIRSLECGQASFLLPSAVVNQSYNSVATVPYTGGNGMSYSAGQSIASSGVAGMTATLQSGVLVNGNGIFQYTISGTPQASGNAVFLLEFGGKSCSISLPVNIPSSATVGLLGCNTASFSVSAATVNQVYTGTATVPYSGGNGSAYSAGVAISSIGVTGLYATLQAGTLTNTTGNINFQISGTPAGVGLARFPILFGGQTCMLVLPVNSGTSPQLPPVYNLIYGASNISFDGTFVTITTRDTPGHKSVYFLPMHPKYEAFSGPTFNNTPFVRNPNNIIMQNITLKIPVNPTVAAVHQPTPMGVIGVAIDGVPLFNQYAAGGSPLTGEIGSFDQYWAHPQQTGMYHYHVEPKYLTTVRATKHSLMGFLLDGFPVYGPEEENGSAPTGLDVYHGHTHATVDYPSGMYHYHFTTAAPYLNGNGFYGTAGTVTQ